MTTSEATSTIGALVANAYHPVYRRADGTTWLKINDECHILAAKEGDHWICAADHPALIDPKELVTVLHTADEQVA